MTEQFQQGLFFLFAKFTYCVMKPNNTVKTEREENKMKTMVMNYAKTLDDAIDDVNMKYAIEAGTKIGNDLCAATLMLGMSTMYMGDAAIHATKLTVRTAKTGVKKAIIKAKKLYDETDTTVTIRR